MIICVFCEQINARKRLLDSRAVNICDNCFEDIREETLVSLENFQKEEKNFYGHIWECYCPDCNSQEHHQVDYDELKEMYDIVEETE